MSQCSLPDHAGFRHTKYLIRTLDFSRQNFLLIRGIWWMVSCTALPTLTRVGLRWRQLFCPLPLLWFDYGSETRKIHFLPSAEKGERYNSSYVLYFTKVYTNKYFGTFSTLCSVINLIVQLWWKWTWSKASYRWFLCCRSSPYVMFVSEIKMSSCIKKTNNMKVFFSKI